MIHGGKEIHALLPDDGIGTGEDILTRRTHSTNPFIGVAVIIRRELNHNDITVSDVRKNAIQYLRDENETVLIRRLHEDSVAT